MWALLTAVLTVATLLFAFETAMHFKGSAIDGPFQLYNSLRRIAAGFRPGLDFQYFHGLGIPYIHYWLYRLLGGGLRGSELARELLATVAYPLVFLAVFRAFAGDWTRAAGLTVAAFALSYVFKMSAAIYALNGMLGLRSAIPTLIPAAVWVLPDRRRRTVVIGVLLGTSLFVSTEQGLAALAAYLFVGAFAAIRASDRRRAGLEVLGALCLAPITLVVLLTAVAGISGMRGALDYNFGVVPSDQYWFFGAPPNVFVPSWSIGLRMLMVNPATGLVVLGAVVASIYYVALGWATRDEPRRRRANALALMSVYALVSCASLLGVFTHAYVQPCLRILIVLVLLELARFAEWLDGRRAWRPWLGVPRLLAATSGSAAAYAFVTVQLLPATLVVLLPHVARAHVFGSARFGADGIWPQTLADGQRVIDAHRGPGGQLPIVWSTYAGWLEARNGLFHPSFDYVIHALGEENRRAYVDRFRAVQPPLVQTVRPSYTQYEAWIENYDWAFYDELLDWYRVASITPWSIFWERRTVRSAPPLLVGAMQVPANLTTVALPPLPLADSGGPRVLELEVEYDVHNPLAWLPVVGSSPRYLVGIAGATSRLSVSLDPFVHQMRFPLIVTPGQHPALHFQTASLLPGVSWTPRALHLWLRAPDPAQAPWLTELASVLAGSRQ